MALALAAPAVGLAQPTTGLPPSDAALTAPAGVHYQVLPGSEPGLLEPSDDADDIVIFLPRPKLAAWDVVEVTESATNTRSCLELGSLVDPGEGFVLMQAARVVLTADEGQDAVSLNRGETCSTILRADFGGELAASTAVAVIVHRAADTPFPDDSVNATVAFGRVEASTGPPSSASTPGAHDPGTRVLLLEVSLANTGTQPVELVGIADATGFSVAGGRVFRLPLDAHVGTVRELEALAGDTTNVSLAAGETVRLGLLFDAHGDLARVAGTLTVQPALLIRRGEQTYSLRLNRVSTSWGDDLP